MYSSDGLGVEIYQYFKSKGIELEWKQYQSRSSIYQRAKKLKQLYNLSLEQFDKMSAAQNDLCAICLQKTKGEHRWGAYNYLTVDHCHKTGKIRGLLCIDCNYAIGRLGDNIENLERAVEYLRKNI